MPVTVRIDPTAGSQQAQIIPDATPTNDGVMTAAQAAKLAVLTPGGSDYGLIEIDSGPALTAQPTLNFAAPYFSGANNIGNASTDVTILDATHAVPGLISAADKTKLDGVTAGAAVASVSGAAPITSTGGATPIIGITAATGAAAGSMSAADKTKLDGITAGAAVASVSGTAPITSTGGTTPVVGITAATPSASGSMSAADKTKLDGIPAGGGGIIAFAQFYALVPGDNAPIAIGAAINFPNNGATNGVGITRTAADTVTLAAVGTYKVTYEGSFDEPGQLAVWINGVAVAISRAGRATGTSQIVNCFLLTTVAINALLTWRNDASPAALTPTPIAGGTGAVTLNILIERLT